MLPWNIILDKQSTAKENMQRDRELFFTQKPTIRIYGWINYCITLGYFQDERKELDLRSAKKLDIDWAKRPTGGGIAFHSEKDVACSVCAPLGMLPKGLMNSYLHISSVILRSLHEVHIAAKFEDCDIADVLHEKAARRLCFARTLSHEISVNGIKIVGSAQKRTKEALIQQGAISIHEYNAGLLKIVREWGKIDDFKNGIEGELPGYEIMSKVLFSNFSRAFNAV